MTALIIDDERLARNEIKRLLEDFPQIEILGEVENADQALLMVKELDPDLLFLDIQMPGKTGFELLAELGDHVPEVIFTTAYDEYAIKAFEFSALDYILKPIDPDRLAEAIAKIDLPVVSINSNEKRLGEHDRIFVKDGEKCWFVELVDVRLFESQGNYVRIHFKDQKPMILKSLNSLEDKLDPKIFFRANRKHIVNLKKIKKIEPWFSGGLLVSLKESEATPELEKIEVSRRQSIRFKDTMML